MCRACVLLVKRVIMSASRAPIGHHITNEQSAVCLHNEQTGCSEIGLNTFETKDTTKFPQGDVMNIVARGAITKSWNLGLRNPQAKKLSVDTYNGGCLDVHGCVPSIPGMEPDVPGFACGGAVGSMGPALHKAYDYMNAPFLGDGFEYKPPDYMMGIKDSGPNSVDGWKRTQQGVLTWEQKAKTAAEASFAARGLVVPLVPGCG